MKPVHILLLLLLIVPVASNASDLTKPDSKAATELVLRYDKPAAQWMSEALPVGNGDLGAMVFGGVDWERIQFNEKSLWNGDEKRAGAYQAFGNLILKFDHPGSQTNEVTGYSRTLDINRAVQSTTYEKAGIRYTREVIASYPAGVILVRITADKPGSISGRLWLTDMHGGDVIAGHNRITCSGILNNGLDYESQVAIISDGGTVSPVLESGFDNKPFPRIPPGTPSLDGKQDAYLASGNAVRNPHPYFDLNDTDASGKPIVIDGAWFDRGLTFRAQGDITFALGGKYRWVSFTTSLGRGGAIQVLADGKLIGDIASPGGYVCLPLTGAKELKITSKNNAFIVLGHLRVSPSETEPPKDPGLILPVSAERAPFISDRLPAASLKFDKCNAITLVLGAKTSYLPDRTKGWRGPHPHVALKKLVETAAAKSYSDHLAAHVRDYQSLFGSLSLNLGTTATEVSSLTTDRRLERYGGGERDPELEALFFQFGRYLLISSSRAGGLPANLQGVWNEVNTPVWRSDYHADINVEMNYWPSDVANLSDCFLPLMSWIENSVPVWTEATHAAFHVPGWTMRGENGIMGGVGSQWYHATNAWLCRNLWDHYEFTQDKRVLERIYPIMRQACDYWEAVLIQKPDGSFLTPVTYSPEHGPHEEGISVAQQLVWDLFSNTSKAAEILAVDRDFRERIAAKRDKLVGPQIGRWGQLQEWLADIDDPQDHHRHTSHLVGVYPGVQISPSTSPELAKAAGVSLTARGEDSTGWALAWRINIWARLLDPESAYRLVRRQLRPVGAQKVPGTSGGGTYANLLDSHPPFQIDGNFGFTSGVAEMLVQSQNGTIELLPALPSAWADGSVKGIRARGGFAVEMSWKSAEVTSFRITSKEPRKVKVRVNGELKTVISETNGEAPEARHKK